MNTEGYFFRLHHLTVKWSSSLLLKEHPKGIYWIIWSGDLKSQPKQKAGISSSISCLQLHVASVISTTTELSTGMSLHACIRVDRVPMITTFCGRRDLHPRNVLVTKIYHPNGPSEDSMDFDVLVADFGESKRLGDGGHRLTSSTGKIVCAIGHYMPKEVGEEGGWSNKADVFCFGRIAETMLSIRVSVCTSEQSKEAKAIPMMLKKILEQCLSENAEERPHMINVRQDLDDLLSQLDDGEAEWTTIEVPQKPLVSTKSQWSTLEF
jgi:hypothetical protein